MADDIRVAPSSEPSIPADLQRQVGEHGYPKCECDLYDDGDPECEIPAPYETHGAYLKRLRERIGRDADLLRLVLKSDYVTENLRADIRAALPAPSGVTKCPDCGGNFELCRCHRT